VIELAGFLIGSRLLILSPVEYEEFLTLPLIGPLVIFAICVYYVVFVDLFPFFASVEPPVHESSIPPAALWVLIVLSRT